MNRTKHTIGWCDLSWNPITGCKHGCWYCYAERLTKRFKKNFPYGFEPHFYPERLKEPWQLKKPSKIFVCSIADLFAPWTNGRWRDEVLFSMVNCPVKHIFQMLTKNPERIKECLVREPFPKNWWLGTTVTNENGDWMNIEEIKTVDATVLFVSFEPLLGPLPDDVCLKGLQWVIMGKLTGSRKVKLDPYWIRHIRDEAERHNIPVFMKNNLGLKDLIQEFPK